MAGVGAELFLPAHGLPITGAARIKQVLLEVAETLEKLISDTLAMMNAGAPLNDIVHSVKVAPEMLQRPYLRPLYDEPEFVVRNLWRMYGGWYDGNPANLKPAPDAALASELAVLAGGAEKLAARAQTLANGGELRLACHLVEIRGARGAGTEVTARNSRRDLSTAARQRNVADGQRHFWRCGRRVARRRRHRRSAQAVTLVECCEC